MDAEENPSSLRVHIKTSKTDPFRQGCFIYLGRGQAPLCPIAAIMSYLRLRGSSLGPLFIDSTGRPLTRVHLSSFLQSTIAAAGIPGQFSGHSFLSVAESSRHLALPPSLPLFLSTVFQCDECLFLSLVRGGSWLGCSVVPAMGALFSLGAGCQKWKPLDIPGTQPPLSDAVVNNNNNNNNNNNRNSNVYVVVQFYL